MAAAVTEQQLRSVGALKETCTEQVARVCLMCGTAAVDVAEWQRNGGRCGICANETYRDECTRCRGACPSSSGGRSHPCVSVTVFRATGRIAFPECVGKEPKREQHKKKEPPKRSPEPVPPIPPAWSWLGNTMAGIWRRYREGFSRYAVFEGRSSRKDFLAFMLMQALGFAGSGAVGAAPLFLVVTAVPMLAIAVRRLHDVGLSGHWMWLLALASAWSPAAVVLMAMCSWVGQKGPNGYGPPPT